MDNLNKYIYHQDASGVIYNGDCLEILPLLDKVDLVVTDPPYGIDIIKSGKVGGGKLAPVTNYGASDWDEKIPEPEIFRLILAFKNQIMWGGNYFTDNLKPSKCWLVWDKDNTGNFADCELAWTSFDMAVRKFKYRWNGMLQEHGGKNKEVRVHPTQKPLPLMTWCISLDKSNPQTILDPFLGSGTTAVAAKQLGRKYIGIEISEKYCEIAKRRLQRCEFDIFYQQDKKKKKEYDTLV